MEVGDIEYNIAGKKNKNLRKFGYVGIGLYFVLLIGLNIGLSMNQSLFWGMMAVGVIGSIILILVSNAGKEKIKKMLDKPSEIRENIVKDVITPSEAHEYMEELVTIRGYSAINKKEEVLGTYGDIVKRRILMIPFMDEYSGIELLFMISLSEPQHFSILSGHYDSKIVDKYASSLAYAKAKEPVVTKETRVITGEDGEKKQVEIITESGEEKSNDEEDEE